MKESPAFSYDGFASHATDPDGSLVRAVEARLETFHTRHAIAAKYKHELELCVDGRDFIFSRRDREAHDSGDIIERVVRSYQGKSRALVVFSGPSSRDHRWVGQEIEWWDEVRPNGPIYFALTHGPAPDDNAANMPGPLLRRGGGDNAVFFDLRGYYRRRRPIWDILTKAEPERTRALRTAAGAWRSVRDFDEEVGKLAARLTCDALGEDASLDAIENSYVAAVRSERLWRRTGYALASLAVAVTAAFAVYWASSALHEQRRARVSTWIQQAEALSETSGPDLVQALAYAASAVDDGSDPRASRALYRVMRRLAPIERTLLVGSPAKPSEQTQVATLLDGGRLLVTGGRDSILHLLDVRSGVTTARLPLDAGRIRTIAPIAATSRLAVGTDRGVHLVRLVVAPSGATEFTVEAKALSGERIGGVAVDEKRSLVLAGTLQTGRVVTLPLTVVDKGHWPATPLLTIPDPRYAEKGDTDVPTNIFGLQVRGDSLVVAGIDGVLTVFDLTDGRPSQRWQKVHPHSIFALDVSRDGRSIAVADDDGRLSVYRTDDGSRREAQLRSIDAASIVRSVRGDWVVARADELPSVGVAFDPTGTLLAVTSHDRTVKFLLTRDLLPMAVAVHSSATRGVAFDHNSGIAYTYGDDGVINAVRPLASPLIAEVSEVENIVVAPGGGTIVLLLMRRDGQTELFSLGAADLASPKALSKVSADVRSGIFAGDNRVFLRAPASSRITAVDTDGTGPTCKPKGLDHPNESGNVEIVEALLPGTRPGEVVTVAKRHGDNVGATVRGWDAATCTILWQLRLATALPGTVALVGRSIAAIEAGRRIVIRSPNAEESGQSIEFASEVVSAAGLSRGRMVAQMKDGGLCVCTSTNRPDASPSPTRPCAAQSESHSCAEMPSQRRHTPFPIRRLFTSPSRRHIVATGDFGLVWLIDADRDWRIDEVAPRQLRAVEPRFSFTPLGELIAVPAGDSGIRIISTVTGKAVAELPTPSRVMQLAFSADASNRLLSIDGDVLRVWDWSRGALLREACRRWPAGGSAPGVSPRSEICDR